MVIRTNITVAVLIYLSYHRVDIFRSSIYAQCVKELAQLLLGDRATTILINQVEDLLNSAISSSDNCSIFYITI